MPDTRIFSEHYSINVVKNKKVISPICSLKSHDLYVRVHELSYQLAGIVNDLNDKDYDNVISNVVRAADASLYALLVCLNDYK